MRRRGGFGLFGFIFMMMMLSAVGDMFDLFFGLAELIIPVGVFAIIFSSLFRLISTMFREGNAAEARRTQSSSRKNRNTSNVRNSRNAAIDKVLAAYFEHNVALVLFDDVSISTQNGTYTTVDNLYVNYKDEKICKLSELKAYYPASYERVIAALSELAKKGGKVVEEKKEKDTSKKEDKKTPFSAAEKFIDQINSLNQGIVNEEVTNGLYQTCDLLKHIDIVDREDGEVDPKLNKLYEYYLPILVGILEDYKRLSGNSSEDEEFKKTETQLVKTVKLINEALKTIYSSLHESDYMNLNADINTLQSLLKQDGLVDTPFKAGEK